jgi:predicted negative regulator of RcsB-dependent stress response
METHETEEQQIAALKSWWKENGSSIVTGIVLGLAVLFGAKAWFAYQERTAQNASNVYMVMMNALETGDAALVSERAGLLIAEFSRTPYAAFAALALAKLKLEEGELEAAQAQLQWALDNSSSAVIQDVVRLRLARVQIARGELDAAAQLLDQAVPGSAFDALYTEVRGDIHAARGGCLPVMPTSRRWPSRRRMHLDGSCCSSSMTTSVARQPLPMQGPRSETIACNMPAGRPAERLRNPVRLPGRGGQYRTASATGGYC